MNDLFNSIGNSLGNIARKIDRSMHSKISGSAIDDFLHELTNYLDKSDALYQISKMPKNTIFPINDVDYDYIQCYLNHKPFYFSTEMIYKPELEQLYDVDDGNNALQLKDDGLYHVVRLYEK